MDEKTIRTNRAKMYIVFAIAAVVFFFLLSGTIRRVALAVCAVYCIGMAYYNFRKARDEDGK